MRCCVWVWLFYLFDGILWIFGAVLTAAGDTRYIMVTSGITSWLFAILPTAFFVLSWGYGAEVGSFFTAFYSLVTAFLFFKRVVSLQRAKQFVALKV